MYPIYRESVRLEKVFDGLWVTAAVQTNMESADDYFRSADLFKEPMHKAQPIADTERSSQTNR